ncbi:MAG: hypothetical protein PHI06_08065 [Desulfobulbaceae bacterium]|nr:hypothetical protein [Desulfobulbaceae bacterium]
MTELEQTKGILEAIRTNLKREKDSVIAILKDPKVAEWQSIDLVKNKLLLVQVGIDPALISKTLRDYPKQAKKIGKQISDWSNEVANQLADLIAHPEPSQALSAAKKLEAKTAAITGMKEELLAHSSQLIRADQVLRQQLQIKPLLAIAKCLTPGKRELFDGGLETLSLLLKGIGQEDGVKTFAELLQEPAILEASFQRLDIAKLPRIVEEILFHHIGEAVCTAKGIALFLDLVNERMESELKSITVIEQGLQALLTENTAALLSGIIEQGKLLGALVVGLYHKRQLKDSLAKVNEALDLLSIFHRLLKNKLLVSLQKEVTVPGSALNPITISTRMTRSFFVGAAGFLRSFKLMVKSLKGQGAINEAELQLTLENGINNCKYFYGGSHADLRKIKIFIDSLVGHYPKPFPYNDLCKLTKATLSAYGDEVEKFLFDYEISKEMQSSTTVAIPTKAGKLIAAIAKHNTVFAKANLEQGNAVTS